MVQSHTFPQDGDYDDAANFAQLVGHPILSDYVVEGLGFNPDYTVPDLTVNQGVCAISTSSETGDQSGKTILSTTRVVQLPQQTVSLTDADVNYIYVEPNFGSDDSATVSAYTSTGSASADALRIGSVDTGSDSFSTERRNVQSPKIRMNDDLDMGGQPINNAGSIEMDGNIRGGGKDIEVQEVTRITGPKNGDTELSLKTQQSGHDTAIYNSSGTTIARFVDVGNVKIPNGHLVIEDNDNGDNKLFKATSKGDQGSYSTSIIHTSSESIIGHNSSSRGLAFGANSRKDIRITSSGDVSIPNSNLTIGSEGVNGQTLRFGGTGVGIYADTSSNYASLYDNNTGDILRWRNASGNVDIPNGDLRIGGNDLEGVSSIRADLSTGSNTLLTDATGSGLWRFRDRANGQNIAIFNEGGNVSIPSGKLSITNVDGSGNSITLDGHIDFTGSNNNPVIRTPGSGSDSFRIYDDANNQNIVRFREGGNVSVPSGSITVDGGQSKVDSSSGGMLKLDGSDEVVIETNGSGSGRLRIWDDNNSQAIVDFNEGRSVEFYSSDVSVSNGSYQTNNFQIQENSSTNSLDFNYTG